jgi:hypothetical protein
MSFFARLVRFFSPAAPRTNSVQGWQKKVSSAHDPIRTARKQLEAKRAAREGDWGETQFFQH